MEDSRKAHEQNSLQSKYPIPAAHPHGTGRNASEEVPTVLTNHRIVSGLLFRAHNVIEISHPEENEIYR